MIANTKTLRQTYDDIADDYSDGIAIINAFYSRFYSKHMPRTRKSLLDIGCGTGDMLVKLSGNFEHSFGIDPIEKFVATAKQRAKKSTIQMGSAEALPFKDKSMDYVISHVVFQHADRDLAVEEAVRVLKSGGRLVISEVLSKEHASKASMSDIFRRLLFNYFLLSNYGLKQARQAKAFQHSSSWKKLTTIHRARRFDFEQLQLFYSKKLPGATLQHLDSKIVAVIWDKA